jgi:hypothetical protein
LVRLCNNRVEFPFQDEEEDYPVFESNGAGAGAIGIANVVEGLTDTDYPREIAVII